LQQSPLPYRDDALSKPAPRFDNPGPGYLGGRLCTSAWNHDRETQFQSVTKITTSRRFLKWALPYAVSTRWDSTAESELVSAS